MYPVGYVLTTAEITGVHTRTHTLQTYAFGRDTSSILLRNIHEHLAHKINARILWFVDYNLVKKATLLFEKIVVFFVGIASCKNIGVQFP